MATPPPPASDALGSPPLAQVVGNAFVLQYYNILHQSPDLVYRFYHEASRLGRPTGPGADMDTVTTMEAINDKIMSMDVARAEIRAVDAQESLGGGVTVLVTGHLTGRDDVRREFVQSFFLAPQEKGYFVLNDILRYSGEGEAEPAPKKSYTSIVKVMKEVPPPTSTVPSRPAPLKPERQAPPPAPVADVPAFSPNPERSNIQGPEVDAHAIYVRNLPLNATIEQLEEQFKRFGTIKRDGIQIRSHKIQGFCYGFVEFEDASSVQSAIVGSPVMISDRQCYVQEKRTTGSRGSSRGRFATGRGGNFQNEGMRGRGNYTGHCEYSELAKKFMRQKKEKDAWRIFSNEDYSDTRNQDSDSLARVEEQHYTLCKDVNAWLALVKQCQKGGLYHTCMQQAPPQLLGRDDIKQRIAEKMLGSNGESNCTVICIVAGSGLGKTSLLRVLHNDQQLLDAFDKRICIQMSDKFDKLMLFRNIIEYAMHEHCSITNLSFLEEMVKEELADKKFLLFLDDADIEDQQFWTSALEILNTGVKGSAVVIATRSTTVADFTAGALHSYYLDPLSEERNLMLLQPYACIGQDIHSNPDLVAIAKRFIARFGANPLKLKAFGAFLSHSDTIPFDEGRFEGDTVPCLQLCHDSLPIYLKQCLAFCSLFPKGYIFDKHHMVLLWLSQGFIVPAEGRELEDIGVGYFHELLCRSFFQYSPFHNEKDNKFVMHELIYNVVVSISHDKYFKSEDPLSHIPENICHLSLVSSQCQTVQLASRTEELKDLQTFLIVQPEWQQRKISFPTLNFCLNDFFLKFRSLETLDLSYTDIEELPSSIVGLRNLRYLSLNNTSIRALPSELCSLSNLQTLEAKDCHYLTELPEDTRRLLKLRHLNVGKKLGYVRMPRGVGQLTELRTVPVFHVGCGLSHCSINELGNLYSLRGCLLVAGLENVRNGSEALEANLNYKQHLRDLTLQWHNSSVDIDDDNEEAAENVAEQVLESLQPHANLQELAIRCYQGNEFPSWMQGSSSLPSLVSLTLDSCCNCTRFPAIAQLPSLKFLSVRKMYEVQWLSSDTHGAIKFPSLELLNLWEMYGLEELFEVSEGDCPRLRKICISRCPFLKRLPCIPSVVELVLHCCDQLPDFPELASLASLKIEGFHSVRSLSLPPQLPALRKLDIRGCNELSSVHGLSVLTAVERLKIAGCPKLDLSKN